MLGDSFIEAVQVPFADTAGQRLEKKLNARVSARWEVLNFGVSNYGLGQFLLAWQQHARDYQPDVVTVMLAQIHLLRTLDRHEAGAFAATAGRQLALRPTFELVGERLLSRPAADTAAFAAAQDALIANEFDGGRSRRKQVPFLLPLFARELFAAARGSEPAATTAPVLQPAQYEVLFDINLRILAELARDARERGAQLIVANASAYFGDPPLVAERLNAFCAAERVTCIPFADDLAALNATGIDTRWPHDGHFNVAGNEALAAALGRAID